MKKKTRNFSRIYPCFIILLISLTNFSLGQSLPDMPMEAPQENTLRYEWSQKSIFESKLLSGIKSMESWDHEGYGSLSLSGDKYYKGGTSLLLTAPTKGEAPTTSESFTDGRPWGAASAIYTVPNKDWSEWNRISFWVYPDLPGFKVVSLSLVFHNDGEEKVPGPYNRNGLNYKILKNQQWNKVYWEIAHLGRDKVTGIELRYRLQGNEPGATETVKYYFDEIHLEKVKPDHYEGWNVAPGHIAHNHIGYATEFPKRALASDLSAKNFKLVDVTTNRTVLEKPIKTKKTSLGTFQVMDFSEVGRTGEFVLKAGDVQTKPFQISRFEEIYRSTLIKTINHFYCQRCGADIPGIHDVCHRDWTGIHGDKSLQINGGWHDAGDLSQGLVNTAESVYSMFSLAEELRDSEAELSQRLLEEAKWGLDWMLKTRFGDGYRIVWSTMDFWTDGIIGTLDDVPSEARNNPHANFVAAKTEARAAQSLKKEDPGLAGYALQCAKEDWSFAMDNISNMNIELAGYALNASLNLYETTLNEKYKNAALSYGNYILQCQQQENLATNVLLNGFFYRDSTREDILHYKHRGHEQEPVVGLVRLCEFFPENANAEKWENAIRLYANYYKDITEYTDPYFMIPAGIYDLSKAEDEVEREQIKSGFRLNGRYYLKSFPTWESFRGNSGTILSQAKGLTKIGSYLEDRDLKILAYRQLEWHLGLNPFNQSLMYGEGYRYGNQYSAMSGNIVGGLPVGVQTHFNRDLPYWPSENCYNWKEIWVHPSSRWLWIMSDFYQ